MALFDVLLYMSTLKYAGVQGNVLFKLQFIHSFLHSFIFLKRFDQQLAKLPTPCCLPSKHMPALLVHKQCMQGMQERPW